MRCMTIASATAVRWQATMTVRSVSAARFLHPRAPPTPATPSRPSTAAAAAPQPPGPSSRSPSVPVPSSEDYRALLLDLLLYRQETLTPVLTALKRERAELEAGMRQLELQVRELRQIREELRTLAQEGIDREHARLVDAVSAPTTTKYGDDRDGKRGGDGGGAAAVPTRDAADSEIVL